MYLVFYTESFQLTVDHFVMSVYHKRFTEGVQNDILWFRVRVLFFLDKCMYVTLREFQLYFVHTVFMRYC